MFQKVYIKTQQSITNKHLKSKKRRIITRANLGIEASKDNYLEDAKNYVEPVDIIQQLNKKQLPDHIR